MITPDSFYSDGADHAVQIPRPPRLVGFTEVIQSAAALIPGQRVAWFGGTFRVVASVSPIADGTDHLRVEYSNETSNRYARNGLVRVLDVAPVEIPVESADAIARLPAVHGLASGSRVDPSGAHHRVDLLSWTDA